MNKVLNQCSMYDYCKSIELFFTKLFQCERVNVILCHRFKKYLYRIGIDTNNGGYTTTKFDLQAGLAGYVCISSHSVITDSVPNEAKFNQQVDDPLGTPESPALQMISCPVNASEDFYEANKEGVSNYPRAIIQLINKKG